MNPSPKRRRLRVLVPMHEDLVPPQSIKGLTDQEVSVFKTEYDVTVQLENLGHEVMPLGVASDLGLLRDAILTFKPHVTFNLLEEFHGVAVYDHHVVSYLELMRRRYTGCNPRGLLLAHDKALSKQILSYHRIPVPAFAVFPIGRSVRRPRRLEFPLFVKSLTEEGSVGISRASLVQNDEQLRERVEFIHRSLNTAAIAEQFIEGRELYVGILGNQRLDTLPTWEIRVTKADEDTPLIATSKVKWDLAYQKKKGIVYAAAKDLPQEIEQRLHRLCKRAYRTLNLTGYARMDVRLTLDGRAFIIEANPNPQLSYGDIFPEAAHTAGIPYDALIQKILNLGLSYRAEWQP